jgi:hypothetical protein
VYQLAVSAPVHAKPVPQTLDEAGRHAQQYIILRDQVKEIDRQEKAEIARIKEEAAERRQPLIVQRDEHFAKAHAWAEANRRGRKTIKLPNGRELRWRRPSSPKLIITGTIIAIARLLLRLEKWEKYVDIKLKKNNIKADFDELVKTFKGLRRLLRLDDSEYFSIG